MKTGVQGVYKALKTLDSGFRRNDGKRPFSTFYECIRIRTYVKAPNPLFRKKTGGRLGDRAGGLEAGENFRDI